MILVLNYVASQFTASPGNTGLFHIIYLGSRYIYSVLDILNRASSWVLDRLVAQPDAQEALYIL